MFSYLYKRRFLFSTIFVISCFLFIILSQIGKQRISLTFFSVTQNFVFKIYESFNSFTDKSVSLWDDYIALTDTVQENNNLKSELKSLRQKIQYSKFAEEEYNKLLEELKFSKSYNYESVMAEIVYANLVDFSKLVIINKGSEDSLAKDDGVINSEGAVGRLLSTNDNFSLVQLITDTRSNYAVLIQRTGENVMLSGTPEGRLRLYLVPQKTELKIGDRITTSALTGIFPKGIIIGEVESIRKKEFGLFQEAFVKPSVNFSKINWVSVIKNKERVTESTINDLFDSIESDSQ